MEEINESEKQNKRGPINIAEDPFSSLKKRLYFYPKEQQE